MDLITEYFYKGIVGDDLEANIYVDDCALLDLVKHVDEPDFDSILKLKYGNYVFELSVSGLPTLKSLGSYFISLNSNPDKYISVPLGLTELFDVALFKDPQFNFNNDIIRKDEAVLETWFSYIKKYVELINNHGYNIKEGFKDVSINSKNVILAYLDYSNWPRVNDSVDLRVADFVFETIVEKAALWKYIEKSLRINSAKLKRDADVCFKVFSEYYLDVIEVSKFYFELADIAKETKDSFTKYIN